LGLGLGLGWAPVGRRCGEHVRTAAVGLYRRAQRELVTWLGLGLG
jgi:hypothetical protein